MKQKSKYECPNLCVSAFKAYFPLIYFTQKYITTQLCNHKGFETALVAGDAF